jgi:hypothetical protein
MQDVGEFQLRMKLNKFANIESTQMKIEDLSKQNETKGPITHHGIWT